MKKPGLDAMRSGVAATTLLALASCAQASLNPVDWYHAIEGGRVADERPPPPQSDAPYPNLGSVPARPAPIDIPGRAAIAQGLVADRTNAQYSASQSPLPPPANPARRPVPPTPRPAGEEAAAASLPAASAPPPADVPAARPVGPLGPPQLPLPEVPMTVPRKAPTQAVRSAALPAIAAPVSDAPNASQDVGARPDLVIAQGRPAEPQSGLPSVPTTPPPPPQLPGATGQVPKLAPKPAPPMAPAAPAAPVAPVAPVAPAASDAAAAPAGAVLIAFPAGSSELPPSALMSLRLLSQQRAGNPIAVTGYGDLAVDVTEFAAQSKALPLALERGRVVAARLLALGVPGNAVRVNAEAQGRGAAARIVR